MERRRRAASSRSSRRRARRPAAVQTARRYRSDRCTSATPPAACRPTTQGQERRHRDVERRPAGGRQRPPALQDRARRASTTARSSGGRDSFATTSRPRIENDYGIEPNNSLRQFIDAREPQHAARQQRRDFATSLNYVDQSEHLGADIGASALLGAEVGHSLLFPASRGFYPELSAGSPADALRQRGRHESLHRERDAQQPPDELVHAARDRRRRLHGEDARAIERFAPPDLAPFLPARRRRAASVRRCAATRSSPPTTAARRSSISRRRSRRAPRSADSSTTPRATRASSAASGSRRRAWKRSRARRTPSRRRRRRRSTRRSARTRSSSSAGAIGCSSPARVARRQQQRVRRRLQVGHVPEGQRVVGRERGAVLAAGANASTRCALRAAYGESGRQPTAFSALRTFTPVTGPAAPTPSRRASIGNPDLKPERGKELEVGFEASSSTGSTLNLTYFSKQHDRRDRQPDGRAVERILRRAVR